MLALHKMVEGGHTPTGLLVMMNAQAGRSWFHGVEPALLERIAESLGIPLLLCRTSGGAEYDAEMERTLRAAKAAGAELCAFGDIDIEGHRAWDEARCAAADLTAALPLWGRSRLENVREAVELGYRCVIKCVDRDVLPERLLGRALDGGALAEMEALGVDLCGENGEYHTVVVDGPLFRRPVRCACGEILRFGHISAVNLTAEEGRP